MAESAVIAAGTRLQTPGRRPALRWTNPPEGGFHSWPYCTAFSSAKAVPKHGHCKHFALSRDVRGESQVKAIR
jgi:hypothetical protein